MVAGRSRPSVRGPSSSKRTIASSTVTVPIVRSSRCGFVTLILITPGSKVTRRMSNSSAGGAFRPIRSTSEPPVDANSATTPVSASTGRSAQMRHHGPRVRSASVDDIEESHPAELRELGLVCMEHELSRVVELDLENATLALAEHHRVGVLELLGRARAVEAEELTVQVERVDQVELGQVRQVHAHELLP